MKKIILTLMATLLMYASASAGQAVDAKEMLPKLYVEQKLERAVSSQVAVTITGIAFAKQQKLTPKEYGVFVAKVLCPSWDHIKDQGIAPFLRGLYFNFQTDPSFKIELTEETATSVSGKMTRYGDFWFKKSVEYGISSGVTVKDYDEYLYALISTIADFIDLKYTQNVKDGWITFNISEK